MVRKGRRKKGNNILILNERRKTAVFGDIYIRWRMLEGRVSKRWSSGGFLEKISVLNRHRKKNIRCFSIFMVSSFDIKLGFSASSISCSFFSFCRAWILIFLITIFVFLKNYSRFIFLKNVWWKRTDLLNGASELIRFWWEFYTFFEELAFCLSSSWVCIFFNADLGQKKGDWFLLQSNYTFFNKIKQRKKWCCFGP